MRYSTYKTTDYNWLGDIPFSWRWLYLSQTCDEQGLKNVGNTESNVLSLSYGNIIRKKNIDFGLSPKDYGSYQIVDKGNIIMRLTDLQNDHKSLRTGLVKERGIITSAYVCLKPFENSAYLRYLLHSYDTQKFFYGLGGGVRQSIGFKDIRYIKIPLPPRDEQDQIVRYLDWKVSQINKLINAKRRQIALLQEEILVLTNQAIEDTKVRLRIKNIVDVVRGWIVRDDSALYDPIGVLNRGRGVFRKEPLLGADLGTSEFFFVEPDTLIISGQFAWEGSVALTSAKEDGCIASHRYYTVRGKSEICNTEYLWALFQTVLGDMLLNSCSHGAAGRNKPLNFKQLLNEYVPVPSQEKQDIIAKSVRLLNIFREKSKMYESLLTEYRTRLISDVVTGKLDVRGVVMPEFEVVGDDAPEDNQDAEDINEMESD